MATYTEVNIKRIIISIFILLGLLYAYQQQKDLKPEDKSIIDYFFKAGAGALLGYLISYAIFE